MFVVNMKHGTSSSQVYCLRMHSYPFFGKQYGHGVLFDAHSFRKALFDE